MLFFSELVSPLPKNCTEVDSSPGALSSSSELFYNPAPISGVLPSPESTGSSKLPVFLGLVI